MVNDESQIVDIVTTEDEGRQTGDDNGYAATRNEEDAAESNKICSGSERVELHIEVLNF